MDIAEIQEWVGRTEERTDQLTAAPVAALSATLDRDDPPPQPGDVLPPLWHWLYFLPIHRQSELGPDGHARRGEFLPPVPLPHRMWGGNRLEFHHPLRIGETLTRVSRIAAVTRKEGRTGPLVFVTVRHQIANSQGIALTEEHDIVYVDHSKPAHARRAPQPAPTRYAWERTIHPGDVLLFRYSALTFNPHRIHYDRRYATEVEGYPDLVVHGPLIATLLLDLLRRSLPHTQVVKAGFRVMSPLFDNKPFSVRGQPEDDGTSVRLWAQDAAGGLAAEATATLEAS